MSTVFPEPDMALTHILVVSDLERSQQFYEEILGADLHGKYGGASCVYNFCGAWLLVVTGGEPTPDKPEVSFKRPDKLNELSHSMTIRVSDCKASYEILRSRGAEFITPPYDWEYEIRCFFRDPDGHLFEISEIKR
jgi:catechol 2,3-dioxygenase-like lactoylglutathione lyase family enzyme